MRWMDLEGLGSGSAEIELGPAGKPGFPGTQAMPICPAEQDDIAQRVAATPPGDADQPVHLVRTQIIALRRKALSTNMRTFDGRELLD